MKILVLTSRYTATRDIIGEDFGRQTRLFAALRKRGHDIHFYCADYRKHEQRDVRLHGIRVMIRPLGIWSFFPFISELKRVVNKGTYDVVIATSDPLWGIIGRHAAKNSVPFIYDLHDNYETYAMYSIPFFGLLERNAIKKANAVTTVSHALKDHIKPWRKNNVFVIQNGVDISIFKPMLRKKCRKELGLRKDALIIGYAGSIQRIQGVDILLEVFNKLKKDVPELHVVIAGRFFGNEKKYINLQQDGVHYLGGNLPQQDIAKLINASDVVVVPNRENSFTKFCFPYKVVEYMACNTPIVATAVGDVARLLKPFKESLCLPDDVQSMEAAIKRQLEKEKINYRKAVKKNTWDNVAKELDEVVRKIARKR
jgi:glycosyltransferase involved in cell wall biosynthesis